MQLFAERAIDDSLMAKCIETCRLGFAGNFAIGILSDAVSSGAQKKLCSPGVVLTTEKQMGLKSLLSDFLVGRKLPTGSCCFSVLFHSGAFSMPTRASGLKIQ